MKRMNVRAMSPALTKMALASIAALSFHTVATAGESAVPPVSLHAAEHVAAAIKTAILGAARAGSRVVAVGDHGVVLLSDDEGKTYRQARSVPTDLTLTSVFFVGPNKGWAAGHGGVILATDDGGETWRLQRSDLKVDQPLFSIFFSDANHGWAVGLWSLALHTVDGGKTWTTVTIPPAPGAKKADRNLYSVFAGKNGALFITSEQGMVLCSRDGGGNWSYVETGYRGSLWTGIALADGTLVVGGLRGSLLYSNDNGATWTPAKTSMKSSITALAQQPAGSLIAVGLDGAMLVSNDGGKAFSGTNRPDRAPLTFVLPTAGATPLLFSDNGPILRSN